MKLTAQLLLLTFAGVPAFLSATAQTARRTPAAPAAAPATTAAVPCDTTLPTLSPKIPALPAGSPCPRPLYTITTLPSVKIAYQAPIASPALADHLGIESSSFSLDYVDTQAGTGEPAAQGKYLNILYTGYLTDGTKFDSSADHGNDPLPVPYGQHQVIPGWDTGFDGMRAGGKRRLYIPFQLAYGPQAQKGIPGRSMLIFDVELVSVSDAPPQPKPSAPTTSPAARPGTTPGTNAPGTSAPADPTKPTAVPPAAAPKP